MYGMGQLPTGHLIIQIPRRYEQEACEPMNHRGCLRFLLFAQARSRPSKSKEKQHKKRNCRGIANSRG